MRLTVDSCCICCSRMRRSLCFFLMLIKSGSSLSDGR